MNGNAAGNWRSTESKRRKPSQHMAPSATELSRLDRRIEETARDRASAGHFAAWRDVLEYFDRINSNRDDPEPRKGETNYLRLWDLAKRAMVNLGGQVEPSLVTLADYDHERNGPLLGVSNEGG